MLRESWYPDRREPDYSKGKIYRLDCLALSYVGITVNTLKHRLGEHRRQSNRCSSKKLFGLGEPVIITLIEDFPCETLKELMVRERYWINQIKCVNENGKLGKLGPNPFLPGTQ